MGDLLERLEGWDSPFLGSLSLLSKKGEVSGGDDGKESIIIVENIVEEVDVIKHQILLVKGYESKESVYVRRTVAVLKNGKEVDLCEPMSMPADIVELGVDTSSCAACGLKLEHADLVFWEGHAYHEHCLIIEEE